MNLREHMIILALDSSQMASAVGGDVTAGIIDRAMKSEVIPAKDAAMIVRYLARRFGHNTLRDGAYIVSGLVTVGYDVNLADDLQL